MTKVAYTGSFCPITFGHMNVVEKALRMFSKVVICIMHNSKKQDEMFTVEQRYLMIKEIYKDNPRVEVVGIDSHRASVDVAIENGCSCMVRGLRSVTDYEAEVQLARINSLLSGGKIETIMLVADSVMQDISSSLVREMFSLDKDVSMFVDKIVVEAMNAKKEV
ncbi:MAG: pantetheine-phosphate adenylyltransferase [Clostridia bacterium]